MSEMYEALKGNPMSIQHYEMTHEACIFAVKRNGFVLKKIPTELHTLELCLEAVRKEGLALEYVFRKIINEQICTEAVKNNGLSIQYVPTEFITSKVYNYALEQNGLSIQYIPKSRVTSTRALKAVRQNGLSLKYIPDKLLTKDLFEDAVSQNGKALEFIPSRNKSKRMCIKAIESNPLALEFIPNRFKSDAVLESALHRNWKSFAFFPVEKYTVPTCLEFLSIVESNMYETESLNLRLLSGIVSKFPVEVNENTDIIEQERRIGVRKFSSKYYDHDKKVFYTTENTYFNNQQEVKKFEDFYSFYSHLDGNLADADLINFEFKGIDIKNYDLSNCLINSEVLIKQGVYDNSYYSTNIEQTSRYLNYRPSAINEEIKALQNIMLPEIQRLESASKNRRFYYVSDIHLDHKLFNRFPAHGSQLEIKTYIKNVVRKFMKSIADDSMSSFNKDYLLIAGDVSYNVEISKLFYMELEEQNSFEEIIIVLGNHEYWYFNNESLTVNEIVNRYRQYYEDIGVLLLHNDLLLINDYSTTIISQEELNRLDPLEIENICLKYSNIVFGGTGFSGFNCEHNASKGLYRNIVKTQDEDLFHTNEFCRLYTKLKESIADRRVIILTHTPKHNWSNDKHNSNWFYVNGHTHANVYIKDRTKSVYSDNQVGYYKEAFELKYFEVSSTYDIFIKYGDGTYTITKRQYQDFNRGMGIQMDFNRRFDEIYMLKRSGVYCFLLEVKNKLYLLEGGRIRKLAVQLVEYYYQHMTMYSNALKALTSKYNQALEQISLKVKQLGGSGNIHGCIVDIDFYNHIFLNPVDGSIYPYYATSIIDKYFYSSVEDLLINKRKDLYDKLISVDNSLQDEIQLVNQGKINEVTAIFFSEETTMYKPSNLIKSIQYLTNSNIIRIWNEDLIANSPNLTELSG